jgi:DegV family protein with EDD domain
MPNIHIVTDSCARFTNSHFVQQHPITVVPNKITLGGKTYREDVDISAEEAIKLIAAQSTPPVVAPPTSAEFADVYRRLAHTCEGIISIHASREIYKSWENAKAVAQQLGGSCEVAVIDSQSLCAAQGMLVKVAAKAIKQEASFEDMIRVVRGAVERLYSVYYVETIDYLLKNRIMSESQAMLGAMLGIKPFLTIEEGRLMPIEKVRTRAQAIEQLVEFLVEFIEVEDIAILQHRPHLNEQTRLLQDRLSAEFPGRHFPYTTYSASLAALIGPDATGVVVLEEEMEEFEDDL